MIKLHTEEGLRKLTFSDQFDPAVGVGMKLVEDPALFAKAASTDTRHTDDSLAPDKDHVGVHVIALGEFERYGMNRNGDGFPKKACKERHDTFVKHGHVFIGHKNQDPKYSVGKIIKSAYNEPMGRVHLYTHVNKDKAQDELHKLATTGESGHSMACRVPFDRCDICDTLRKSASDPNQCDHIKYHLGETFEDGKVACTQNDLPTWFDISFVNRPADRIAYSVKVASAGGAVADSVKQAESYGLWVPDELEYDVPGYRQKLTMLQKLASYEDQYAELMRKQQPLKGYDRYLWELSKAASFDLSDAHVEQLREYTPDRTLAKLASAGIVLSAPAFFKYALGSDYGELASEVPRILEDTRSGLFSRLYKQGAYQRTCRNTYFDVDMRALDSYSGRHGKGLSDFVSTKLAGAGAFVGPSVEGRIFDATIYGRQPKVNMTQFTKIASRTEVHRGAEIYAAYKLSALSAMDACCKQADTDELLALAAVQNLVK